MARVNLLVGKNNSGKTALLEGIQFLTSGGDPSVLAQVAGRRGEIIVTRDEPTESLGRRILTDVAHFFHGHALAEHVALSFSGDNGYPAVGVQIVSHKNERSATSPGGRTSPSGVSLKITGPAAKGERDDLGFAVSREGGVSFDQPPRFRRGSAPRQPLDRHVLFVGSDSLNSIDLANMWDEIIETKQELEVAEAMRVLEKDLDSVHFKTGMLAA
ncbi:MAG TPA: hypothetical protein PK867_28460, partial [Pirellulales bacterium]|nr:hypothetical protein [Pirellulales bacterium]